MENIFNFIGFLFVLLNNFEQIVGEDYCPPAF